MTDETPIQDPEVDGRPVVWRSTLDEKYDVYVLRDSSHAGTLRITENGKILKEQEVSLAYGAAFGPDVDDVQSWQQISVEYVDGLTS